MQAIIEVAVNLVASGIHKARIQVQVGKIAGIGRACRQRFESLSAVDLMTGPGRNPAEAEELLGWLQRNEQSWRT